MNPLVLRDELPPDDTVVVVRGGEMNSEFVRRTAKRSFESRFQIQGAKGKIES
jgi:hypothetical protein